MHPKTMTAWWMRSSKGSLLHDSPVQLSSIKSTNGGKLQLVSFNGQESEIMANLLDIHILPIVYVEAMYVATPRNPSNIDRLNNSLCVLIKARSSQQHFTSTINLFRCPDSARAQNFGSRQNIYESRIGLSQMPNILSYKSRKEDLTPHFDPLAYLVIAVNRTTSTSAAVTPIIFNRPG